MSVFKQIVMDFDNVKWENLKVHISHYAGASHDSGLGVNRFRFMTRLKFHNLRSVDYSLMSITTNSLRIIKLHPYGLTTVTYQRLVCRHLL